MELKQSRLEAADIYRGFVMLLMMAEVLNFQAVAEALPNSTFWQIVSFNQSHVAWVGCSLHDLIQPSFSFLVGVVLPFSIASRVLKGENKAAMIKHAFWRSLVLILLGVFLRSQFQSQTYFTFEDTLSQIGLGYGILFALGFASVRSQIIILIIILVGYWAAFAIYPLPDSNFDYLSQGLTPDWDYNLKGFAAHWNKNTNLAWATDTWFLNLFPRESKFIANEGGYATLSFIPTLATMLLGLMAGNILKNKKTEYQKLKTFIYLGFSGMFLALIIHFTGVCPIVKKIWTPSWVLFSGGACFLLLAFFYWTIEILQKGKYFEWIKIIGMNSIAAYVIAHTVDRFISSSLLIHLGGNYNEILGISYKSIIHGGLILLFEWLILRWMFKRKIFLKV